MIDSNQHNIFGEKGYLCQFQKSMAKAKFTKELYLGNGTRICPDAQVWRACRTVVRYAKKSRDFVIYTSVREALVAGAMSVLKPEDNMITAYRDHAHALGQRNLCPCGNGRIVWETGCSKGKGGSMHMFDSKNRFFGGHGIVGGQIPLGAGIAFAEQYLGTRSVTVCYMGDGATRQVPYRLSIWRWPGRFRDIYYWK